MCLYTWCHQGPHKPSSCSTVMLNSQWGRASPGKRNLMSVHLGLLQSCPTLCDLVDCGLPGFSAREGGSPGKNTGAYWPIIVAIPFSVQFSSFSQSCPTLCDPMNRSTPGLPVHHQLPEFTQTHVH